jgi:23S rRNA (pseudouridine1915-N3)-methyltransferase
LEISVLAVGRLKAGAERELCDRYLQRARKAGPRLGLRGFAVEEISESAAARPKDRVAAEDVSLVARLKPDDRVVALDPSGELIDSESFAAALAKNAAAGSPRMVFVIGGPDGLGQGILGRSKQRLAFGRATWPHQLVRVMLAEQIYRATTILSGHPYHRP